MGPTMMAWCGLMTVAVLQVSPAAQGATPANAELVGQIRQLDAAVFNDPADRHRLASMLSADIRRRRTGANQRETAAWSQNRTRAEWEQFRDARRKKLRESLGETPPGFSLRLTVTGTLRSQGYQIENLLFGSRPGLPVTANLYSPSVPRPSMPGILICHSHHNPKSQGELQDMGIGWARQGCLVLVMDQLGHGERRQHPFVTAQDYNGQFQPGRQDYYFRYNVGMQLHSIAESLIGWMAWDLMRGVDLLLAQPGIDPARIILLGAVAGGGDPAAVAAALDSRIAAVVPFNFGGPQPETVYPLPADAEASFNYVGGGSWESTRNLRLSARDGFAPWVIVGSVAPRRLIYAHEFAWDRERDPVWRRLNTIFGFYGAADNLAETHGQGSVRGQGPGNTHCNNIGQVHRVAIHQPLERWFGIAPPAETPIARHSVAELTCITPAVAKDWPMRPLHELADELGRERAQAAREHLAKLGPAERRLRLRRDWSRLLGDIEPNGDPVVTPSGAAMRQTLGPREQPIAVAERLALEVEPEIVVPLVFLRPTAPSDRRWPCVIGVSQHGKAAFLEHQADSIAELLTAGIAVCLPDLRGTGETKPDDGRGRSSSATSLSSSELMLGQTLLGSRVRDLRSVLRYLRTRADLDARRFGLWGESFAAVNSPDANLAVPLDAARLPEVAEPLGGLVTPLTALFEDDVRAVCARGTLVSFQSLTASPFVYVPHDVIVPGALTAGDLCDVAAALAPRPLCLVELVDGQNRSVTVSDAAEQLKIVAEAYDAARAGNRLSTPPGTSPPIADWLRTALGE